MTGLKLTREQHADLDDWKRQSPMTATGELFSLIRLDAGPEGIGLTLLPAPRCDRCRYWLASAPHKPRTGLCDGPHVKQGEEHEATPDFFCKDFEREETG